MKKIGLLTLIVLMISIFTACTNQQTADNYSPSNTQKEEVAVTNEIEGKIEPGSTRTIQTQQNKEEIENSNSKDNAATQNSQPDEKSEHERFDKLVEKFVLGINNKDLNLMAQCIGIELYGGVVTKDMLDMMKGFIICFDNSTSVKYRFIGHEPNSNNEVHLYELYDGSSKAMEIHVSKSGTTELISESDWQYPYFVNISINRYVGLLKSRDLHGITHFFAPEGGNEAYPVSNAEKILEKYSQAFDLDTIRCRLIGIDKNEYIYEIYGTKRGKENIHQVKNICNNGLCGVWDEWVPPIQ